MIEKPPLGLVPKFVRDEERIYEIKEAVTRYMDAGLPLPPEWIAEYNDLTTKGGR